ncbi:UDP-N-acetylenolpyruvoylglucosamine reductase [Paramagnetospirillum kuznetsovii]|uniref:UDP-N-acetylenolpyruvoylglucosamine reductase n=2 Tax=Paramagnetospirillum kuznetsovii TaxID=2053833 RepID=A0A364P161_9PROT|nr:UDP-N-acetylmuramate dehydrogenase [Paramagnetospirillum kuznetsovii]RAU23061.1 UDP-N-acetylenolpyruvoylglucosamine reductase [Paramagnetospirillum kuznetsovii]
MTKRQTHDWRDALPQVRGRIGFDQPMAPYTWFRVGGPAEVLFRPADLDDLIAFLAELPPEIPVTTIGVGSNLLVRDGGVPGVVIRLTGPFATIEPCQGSITAGAGALDLTVAKVAMEEGIAGLEFLSGIPGTIGGALRMNAGAFGSEMKDVTTSAEALDRTGQLHIFSLDDLGFSYRHSALDDSWIFLAATLKGRPGKEANIAAKMEEIRAGREEAQPTRARTGGSTFANPPGHSAWKLVDAAGCRGLTMGGAQISEKHCNFLLNLGDATAADIEDLGEEVRRRVMDASGIELRWEIQRIGVRKEP